MADLLPPADHVEMLFHFGQEAGNLVGVVLEVGVQRHDQFAAGLGEAGAEGGRLAEVAAKADAAHARVAGRQAADHLPGAVAGAVVDEDHVQVVAVGRGHLAQLAVQRLQALGLIEDRNDDGKHRGFSNQDIG